jgi:SLIT-ROBO Rho GTPase activating protein
MFQCIIQPRNGIIHNSGEMKGVFPDVRLQLNDQLRCLDSRLEAQQGQLVELQDIFRRRAEIELNYSRDLEKLGKLVTSRHKEQKTKRELWSSLSSTEIWRQLVAETRKAGRDHAALAEIYSGNIMVRCTTLHDDITRIYKKCREIGFEIHEEVLKVLHELHTAMKTHHTYQSEFRQAESKLAVSSHPSSSCEK